MELRIVGRPGTEPRLVDLDGPAELHPDDRILGPDGQPLGHLDGTETAEQLARLFHEAYERLAPDYGYSTRKASAKPWAEVPEQNRLLMIATCAAILAERTDVAERFGNPAAAGHEPWSYNWIEALERDLTRWLNRNSVDAAVGAPDWELARAVMVQLCAARGPQFPRYFLHGDNHVLPYPGPVPAGWPSA